MATQNLISTGVPAVFRAGTKTFTFAITGVANATGWGRLDPSVNGLIAPNTGASTDVTNTLKISPSMTTGNTINYFKQYWEKNPFYIRRLNIRTSDSAYLPTAIKILTPNIFTGNLEPQTIEVAPNIVSTQYQESIVTLETKILVGRNSWIEIEGTPATGVILNLDMTLSIHASLEEALYSFVTSDNAVE